MNNIFSLAQQHQFGKIHFKLCQKTGMRAIIAIHNTKRGPALGGCRFIEYHSDENALIDALRLAQGMSYKAAMADLPLGGGKSVIIKPKERFSRQDYMRSFGEFVESLHGEYITALDSGTELSDMDIIAEQTSFLASKTQDYGDPSPHTVEGVIEGIKAACKFHLNKTELNGLTMAIQGLGHVGHGVTVQLQALGVNCIVADTNPIATQSLKNVTVISTQDIHKVECDVFVPCALGGIINPDTIPELKCKIIAGAANNQLLDNSCAYELHQKNILFAPDYVINAGGLIFAAGRYLKTPDEEIQAQIKQIYHRLIDIFQISQQDNIPPSILVDRIAKEKIGEPV
jgi:leucine dehydrogenase